MKRSVFLAAASALAMTAPAFAHHSSAMFDHTVERELIGVVKLFNWTNPHGYLQVTVTTSSGRTQDWSIEMQNPSSMARKGLSPSSFTPGDMVTVKIHPLRNGTTGGDFISAILCDGSHIPNEAPDAADDE